MQTFIRLKIKQFNIIDAFFHLHSLIFVESYLWSYLLVRLILIRASHASCRETCIYFVRPGAGKSQNYKGREYIQVPFLLIRNPGIQGFVFTAPGFDQSRAIFTPRVRARLHRVSCLRSDRISLVQSTRCVVFFVFFLLRDVTRVDNFHAGGTRGRRKRRGRRRRRER